MGIMQKTADVISPFLRYCLVGVSDPLASTVHTQTKPFCNTISRIMPSETANLL